MNFRVEVNYMKNWGLTAPSPLPPPKKKNTTFHSKLQFVFNSVLHSRAFSMGELGK